MGSEKELLDLPIERRPGVWTTYGGAASWESVMLRASDDREDLGEQESVGRMTPDVTKRALNGSLKPPSGAWCLLVRPTYGDWSTLVPGAGSDRVISQLMNSAKGHWVQTGYQDTAGVVYVLEFRNGKKVLEYISGDGPDVFKTKRYTKKWFSSQVSSEVVHQKLIVDLGAYVPGFYWDGKRLRAQHPDSVKPKNIHSIDLIEFGRPNKSPSTRSAQKATEALRDAIDRCDGDGVEQAILDGASLDSMPDVPWSPLGRALLSATTFYTFRREFSLAEVARLPAPNR